MRILSLFMVLGLVFGSCRQKKDTLFESLSTDHTHIEFVNKPEQHRLFNILYYLYYYNGGGVSAGDINNDGLPDLYFTANNHGGNKLYLNKGNFVFEDITQKAGVAGTADWCTGSAMADVNGDGLLDIYVSSVNGKYGLKGHNQLYINNGNNTFTDKSEAYGLAFAGLTTQTAFFDMDNDGDLDCYILNQSDHPHASITDTSRRRTYDPLSGDVLLRNDLSTTGKFTDVSKAAGIYQSHLGYGLGISVADFNNDGFADIYIGNDFHENDYYYLNNGNGTFSDSGARAFRHYSRFSMGNDAADFNNDGQMDLISVDMLPDDEKVLKTYGSDENFDIYKFKIEGNGYQDQFSRNCLQRNNGNGSSFSEVGLAGGVAATDWSWSPLFADFDNDGNKDLFISSGIVKRPVDLDYIRFISDLDMHKGRQTTDRYDDEAIAKMPDGSSHPFLFQGDGRLSFKDVSEDWGTADLKGSFNGAAYADLDNDGNLDVVINSINAPAIVLRNHAPRQPYLNIRFDGGRQNRYGLGAKAYVFTRGKMQYQQLMLTRGFESSSEPVLHFGLGRDSTADSVLVVWPGQAYQIIRQVRGDTTIRFNESASGGTFDPSRFFVQPKPPLTLQEAVARWQHRENDFTDFNVQYLIPHEESTRGPKVAVADVNGDGLDDLYACGAKGQAGALLIQQKDGRFRESDAPVFAADAGSEDVDALFFDANGDRFPDLYVASGGNEATGQDSVLLDRLYLNDGKGHFRKETGLLPLLFANKSCVRAADVDGDGDLDLFVGVLADARSYGVPQTSYLLLNDGTGHFSVAPPSRIALSDIGMVTSAVFADLNRDGRPDLMVAGEWMPLTVFLNRGGSFVRSALPGSSGLWQTLYADDVNGDGNLDILAGNWGCNNKFWSGKNGPARLYVKDFDRNGQTDQLLSYTLNGKEYPFLAKDETERQLPVLRKHYLLYSEYAGVEMKDVFYGFVDTVKPLTCERLASAVLYGDGKGGFRLSDLPLDLQLAPVFSFARIPMPAGTGATYLSGGNFFDVIPYEGRYDAQPLSLFQVDRNGQARYISQPGLLQLDGQVRDLKPVRTATGTCLLVARNNAPLLIYRTSPPQP